MACLEFVLYTKNGKSTVDYEMMSTQSKLNQKWKECQHRQNVQTKEAQRPGNLADPILTSGMQWIDHLRLQQHGNRMKSEVIKFQMVCNTGCYFQDLDINPT
jgi:hypothetical protein